MPLQVADRVKETTTSNGTGPLTLAGAMVGYRAFSSVCAVGDTCHYALQAVAASGIATGDWEVGIGTYSAANTLTRSSILASSNAGAAVNLAAGTTKQIWIDYPAAALNSGPLAGMRNKIIGGDFGTNPWQRSVNSGNITSGYTADRFFLGVAGTASFTIAKDNSLVPSVVQAGRVVTHCLLGVVNTADASVAATDIVYLSQSIEGYNFQPLAQRPMVLSFWHCHSKVGIYCVALQNAGQDRSFVAEYTQSVANAYEYTAIAIPPSPSAGSWLYDTGRGIRAAFIMMCGSNYYTTPNVWQNGQFWSTANQVNLADAVNNTFRLALIQIEPGAIATPFEDLPFPVVLQLCQRYFEKSYNMADPPGTAGGTTLYQSLFAAAGPGNNLSAEVAFATRKRVVPTVTTYLFSSGVAAAWTFISSAGGQTNRSVVASNVGEVGFQVQTTTGTDIIGFGHWTADAEL